MSKDSACLICKEEGAAVCSCPIDAKDRRISELEQRIHEACEVYAGMEGFIPVYAETAYVLQTINQMYAELLEVDDE